MSILFPFSNWYTYYDVRLVKVAKTDIVAVDQDIQQIEIQQSPLSITSLYVIKIISNFLEHSNINIPTGWLRWSYSNLLVDWEVLTQTFQTRIRLTVWTLPFDLKYGDPSCNQGKFNEPIGPKTCRWLDTQKWSPFFPLNQGFKWYVAITLLRKCSQ